MLLIREALLDTPSTCYSIPLRSMSALDPLKKLRLELLGPVPQSFAGDVAVISSSNPLSSNLCYHSDQHS
jgi:hypothetical protein